MSGSAAVMILMLAGAQLPAPTPKTPEPPTSQTPAQNPDAPPAAPYRKLFTQPQESTLRARLLEALRRKPDQEGGEPKIVCHMKVIPVDPRLDPKIVIPPPQDVTFHIRRIPAPACTE